MTYLLMVIGIIAMIGGASYATWDVTSGYYRMKEERAVAQAVAVEAKRAADLSAEILKLERKQAEVREVEVVKWKTIKKEVERVVASDPVYVRLECRVTDDGVRLYNAAAAGVQLAAADGKATAVPVQPPPVEAKRDAGRPAGDSSSGLRPIPRVPTGS